MVIMMINVCETMLLNVRNKLKQSKRTNHEIKAMLDSLKESNQLKFDKLKKLYGNSYTKDTFGIMEFEHNEMEKLKKRMYGDNYEIKPFAYYQ